jgi:hypothetical protein
MPPVGTDRPAPPLPPVAQVDRSRCRSKGQRAWFKLLSRKVREQRLIERTLSHCHVSRVRHELRELRIGDGVLLDRERADMLTMDRSLVGIEVLRAHPEASPGQLDQVRQCAHEDDANPSGSALGKRSPLKSDALPSRSRALCRYRSIASRVNLWRGGMSITSSRANPWAVGTTVFANWALATIGQAATSRS